MKGEDPKELKELTFNEKMENLFAPSLKWKVYPHYAGMPLDSLEVEGVDLVNRELTDGFFFQILEDNVIHIHVDPHLMYLLLKDGTVITYLPDRDVLVIS